MDYPSRPGGGFKIENRQTIVLGQSMICPKLSHSQILDVKCRSLLHFAFLFDSARPAMTRSAPLLCDARLVRLEVRSQEAATRRFPALLDAILTTSLVLGLVP